MDYVVSSRKYRPQRFDQVVGQDVCIRTLKNALKRGKTASAYLFSGPRGTGKTTLVRILAKALNCPNIDPISGEPCCTCSVCQGISTSSSLDVLEIDGASNRGIDDIRTLSESIGYSPAHGKYKIFIIDEVHMLTKEAFNALLKNLEEPPPTAKFFFATTEPHKIPETILSRCQRFNLRRLPSESIVQKLSLIAQENNLSVAENVFETLAQYADGGLRDAESLFDQLAAYATDGTLRQELIEEVLGIAPLQWFEELDKAICDGTTEIAFQLAEKLLLSSKDIGRFVDDLILHFRTAYLLKIKAKHTGASTLHTQVTTLPQLIACLQEEQLQKVFSYIQEALKTIKVASSPRFTLEKLLLDIISVRYEIPLPYIVKRLSLLEQALTKKPQPISLSSKEQPSLDLPTIMPTTPQAITPLQITPVPSQVRPKPISTQSIEQEKQRQEHLMQFAAVELEGTLQKKKR